MQGASYLLIKIDVTILYTISPKKLRRPYRKSANCKRAHRSIGFAEYSKNWASCGASSILIARSFGHVAHRFFDHARLHCCQYVRREPLDGFSGTVSYTLSSPPPNGVQGSCTSDSSTGITMLMLTAGTGAFSRAIPTDDHRHIRCVKRHYMIGRRC